MRFFLIFLLLIGTSCSEKSKDNRYYIITGIEPIALLIQQIGGSHIKTSAVIPPNIDPHTFNLKISDGVAVAEADLLIILDEHIDGMLLQISDQTNKIVLKKSKDHHGHGSHNENPHYWLSFTKSIEIATQILNILEDLMPEHKSEFQMNYNLFVAEINTNFTYYKNQQKNIVVVQRHAAWDYLLEELEIKQIALLEEFENQQVSLKKVRSLIDLVKKQDSQVLLIEDAFSTPSSVFKEISKESSANIVVLNPLQTDKNISTIVELLHYNTELLIKKQSFLQ
ncbi:MAG: metal ABC transporter substrate-binding protein [Brevinema sp.]